MLSSQTKSMPTNEDFKEVYFENHRENKLVFNSNHLLTLGEQRRLLPIRKHRDEILYCLENYQTTVIVGETGSGKSTQIPQYLLELGWHLKGIIGITQPRLISAVTLAERVASERGEVVGNTVGYSVSFTDITSNATKIKFMTEGILLREMLGDPLLSSYAVIVVDEAHERSLLSDVVLGLLKKIVKRRPALKLIVASATIDAGFFQKFFNVNNDSQGPSSVILSIEGRMHPVKIFYRSEPCTDYVREAAKTVWTIHKNEPSGGILVFLSGQEEVLECLDLLSEYKEAENCENLQVMPLYGALSGRDQLKAFFLPQKGFRKAVLATNIAETSVTIPGIAFVIDTGFVKLKWFNPETLSSTLVTVPVSKAAAIQRAGRAGRERPGKVYRLYTKETYANLPSGVPPEMQRSELDGVFLHLKALGIKNVLRFDFPSPPPAKNILSALSSLSALEAISENGNLSNSIGYFLAEMPVDPMLGKMLWLSLQMGCSEEILSIVSMLQVRNIFTKPLSAQNEKRRRIAHRNFEVSEGDLITLLNVYKSFVENGQRKEFCGKYFLNYRNLKRACEIRNALEKNVIRKLGQHPVSCNGKVDIICKCIAAGCILNAAYLHFSGVYRHIQSGSDVYINPQSVLYTEPPPRYVVYCELVQTTKKFMSNVTAIQGDWLTELAPQCFSKEIYKSDQ